MELDIWDEVKRIGADDIVVEDKCHGHFTWWGKLYHFLIDETGFLFVDDKEPVPYERECFLKVFNFPAWSFR